MSRHGDGSAGDADYGAIGPGYTEYRRPEPAIASWIEEALGSARSVLNVGAGAGSYEPSGRIITPVEPSAAMRAQRPPHLPAAVDAVAESLPFPDGAFDAALASFTVHQWQDLEAGLREVRRVTRGPVLVLSCDPDRVQDFWLNDYAADVLATERRRYPSLERISALLGGRARVQAVPIPLNCRDGFNEAYYGRPERLLEDGARRANSAWSFVPEDVANAAVARLQTDLVSGHWDARFGHLRRQPEFGGSLRLVVAEPGA